MHTHTHTHKHTQTHCSFLYAAQLPPPSERDESAEVQAQTVQAQAVKGRRPTGREVNRTLVHSYCQLAQCSPGLWYVVNW